MAVYVDVSGRLREIFTDLSKCKGLIYRKFENIEDAENYLANKSIKKNFANKKILESNFVADYYVYCDGACSNNGTSNAKAGIGVYFADNDPRNISEKIDGKQTNNTAELTAIKRVYKLIEKDIKKGKKIAIVSDSEYSLKCVSIYGKKNEKNKWTKDIPNKNLVKEVYELYKNKPNITFMHIRSHTGLKDNHSIGNDKADKLANDAIYGGKISREENLKNVKIYLDVPFARKEEIKVLDGKWNKNKKLWYILSDNKNKDKVFEIFSEI